ncbi:glycosyltransferase WbuB [Brachybacterium vulturis]|uniref:D-inositol 3-phosphate glycosyltransferase n=1 Tax=Brachybacterium vulturis TaxID=2017484 RepID=A0A291GNL5_9MICO|nr:glycosyltransferase [Brachybacterium vulturis]ATG51554.1 glycosyltransferase WbuB [Brachybacterium vulturis]
MSRRSAVSQHRARRPRVVIATRLYTPEASAAAFRLEALARALEEQGADVKVLTTRPPRGVGGEARAGTPSRWPVLRDAQGQVRGYLSYLSFDVPLALRLILVRDMDALVIEPPPTTGAVGAVAAALRRLPFTFYAADVWSDATDSVEGVPGPVRRAVRLVETTVWKRAARVLTISPGVHRRVTELIGEHGQVMIGNGIDTDTFTPDGPGADEEADGSPPYFVYAGTVSEWQGADVFVDAFEQVRRTHPGTRLLFFSEGSGRDALEEMVRERGLEGVEFRSKVPPAEMARTLRGAVAGLSSITPGQGYEFALPTKIYAATACGTPVVHAGEGAANERIDANHLGWSSTYDADAVAASMRAALEGRGSPDPAHLRQWTIEHASLAGCAAKGAAEVLASLPQDGRGHG